MLYFPKSNTEPIRHLALTTSGLELSSSTRSAGLTWFSLSTLTR
jgi:hypothetical protein